MKISIIGIGLSLDDLTEKHHLMIEEADILAGGSRHLNYFPNFNGEKVTITKDLNRLTEILRNFIDNNKRVVVLASGDPLFFGIGSYLSRKLGKDLIRIFPNVSSVAGAFSKINESWHDAKVISLHGRNFTDETVNNFRKHNKIAVLTDKENTPSAIYKRLSLEGLSDFKICVLQCLGDDGESVEWLTPHEPVTKEFSDLNVMIFLRTDEEQKENNPSVFLGMPEDSFKHESGLITKSEVRVVSLSKLVLEKDSIMWDLGAGSGSVSIEASFFIKTGHIYAVEKKESRVGQISENKEYYHVSNLKVIQGLLPEAIESLPDPDRIFIGGGGINLPQIITAGSKKLLPGGIIVINTVLLKSMTDGIETLENLGFETDVIQIQINTGHNMPWNLMLKSQNPVWVICGKKKLI